jgi:hypothetical protein
MRKFNVRWWHDPEWLRNRIRLEALTFPKVDLLPGLTKYMQYVEYSSEEKRQRSLDLIAAQMATIDRRTEGAKR